jgi:hypothetical protein
MGNSGAAGPNADRKYIPLHLPIISRFRRILILLIRLIRLIRPRNTASVPHPFPRFFAEMGGKCATLYGPDQYKHQSRGPRRGLGVLPPVTYTKRKT